MQETILAGRAGHDDMVGELESALKRARGDALVEDLALAVALGLASFDPRTVSVFSRVSTDNSFSANPATASVMR